MDDTIADMAARLRALAVELVKGGRAPDAAAVLSAIGAVDVLSMFMDTTPEPGALVQPQDR